MIVVAVFFLLGDKCTIDNLVLVCRTIFVDLKPTIHEATFVAGDMATLLFVRAAQEILHGTFYKSLGNR